MAGSINRPEKALRQRLTAETPAVAEAMAGQAENAETPASPERVQARDGGSVAKNSWSILCDLCASSEAGGELN